MPSKRVIAALVAAAGFGFGLSEGEHALTERHPRPHAQRRLLNVQGRTSVFGPPTEPIELTADGGKTNRPCIAMRSTRTLGRYFIVRVWLTPHRSRIARLKQCDWGPASWTGRRIDITAQGVRKLGFNPFRYPTNKYGTAHEVR